MTQVPTGDPIVMKSVTGYGAEVCPGCGELPQPGQTRLTVPGIWRVWHDTCYSPEAAACPFCDREHIAPFDGRCLL